MCILCMCVSVHVYFVHVCVNDNVTLPVVFYVAQGLYTS